MIGIRFRFSAIDSSASCEALTNGGKRERMVLHRLGGFAQAPIWILPAPDQHHPMQHTLRQQLSVHLGQDAPRLLAPPIIDLSLTFPQLALVAASEVLIPLQVQVYALRGLAQLQRTIALVQKLNPRSGSAALCVQMYARFVPITCRCGHTNTGKTKVMGRMSDQMIELIYALLNKDAETMRQAAARSDAPAPMLDDPEMHHAHRHGPYRSRKPIQNPETSMYPPPRPG